MEMGGQLHNPATLAPGKEPQVPLGYEAECTPDAVQTLQRREKSLAPAGNWTPVVQPTACHDTIWDILVPIWSSNFTNTVNNWKSGFFEIFSSFQISWHLCYCKPLSAVQTNLFCIYTTLYSACSGFLFSDLKKLKSSVRTLSLGVVCLFHFLFSPECQLRRLQGWVSVKKCRSLYLLLLSLIPSICCKCEVINENCSSMT
jgi:hypothetical protein